MNESVYAHILWQIERGLRYPLVKSARWRVTWLTDSPLTVPEGELLQKMSLAMRLAEGAAVIHSGGHLANLPATDLLIVLGQAAAAFNLPEIALGQVQWLSELPSPLLFTHHPRDLISEPSLKRQSWTQLQVAMAYLKL